MNSGNTSDDDDDKTVTEINIDISNEESLLLSHENSNEEQNKLNCKDNTIITDETNKTETHELETSDSSISSVVSQISDCEPALNIDEYLSNDNNHTGEDSNNENSSTSRNDNGIEDFLRSVEEHHVPEVRWSWEAHFLNVPQVTINADANNHRDRYSANEVELNAFENNRTLYSIIEDRNDERTVEGFETQAVAHSSVSTNDDQYLHRELYQNEGPFYPGYNENYSFVPSFVYNHPRARQLFNNLDVQLVNSNILVQSTNNFEIHNNVLLDFNYNNQVNNLIYIPELNIYRNAMLNALANENILMEELYQANLRLNVIHEQQILDANNNQPANAVADVAEEMDPIHNMELVNQNNLPPMVPEVPVQPHQLPFEQLILIANGGITALNGQYNALIQLIHSNPNLIFLNIRNIILIVHPEVLVGGNNVVFGQNQHWVSVRELLRMNAVILNYENRNNNDHRDSDREAGPSNDRERNR